MIRAPFERHGMDISMGNKLKAIEASLELAAELIPEEPADFKTYADLRRARNMIISAVAILQGKN